MIFNNNIYLSILIIKRKLRKYLFISYNKKKIINKNIYL